MKLNHELWYHRWQVLPSNPFCSILLFEDGRVLKLCDFGTARKLEHTLTNAVGTVLYMAPEVIKSKPLSLTNNLLHQSSLSSPFPPSRPHHPLPPRYQLQSKL